MTLPISTASRWPPLVAAATLSAWGLGLRMRPPAVRLKARDPTPHTTAAMAFLAARDLGVRCAVPSAVPPTGHAGRCAAHLTGGRSGGEILGGGLDLGEAAEQFIADEHLRETHHARLLHELHAPGRVL
jgi:hypothetical protein